VAVSPCQVAMKGPTAWMALPIGRRSPHVEAPRKGFRRSGWTPRTTYGGPEQEIRGDDTAKCSVICPDVVSGGSNLRFACHFSGLRLTRREEEK
jgi:hypothetical protein